MHTKILIRKDSFLEHYQHWLQKDVKDILEMLSGSYANEAFGKGSDDLKCEHMEHSDRIRWQPAHLHHQTFGFLMDLFKTKLIAFAGYRIVLSDERTEVFDNGLRLTIHRHSLKPSVNTDNNNGPKKDFGHLNLEHHFNKDSNCFILTAVHHSGRPGDSFEKLMEFLLS